MKLPTRLRIALRLLELNQGKYLRRTDNGPTVENEEELLRAEFGEPDANGVYRAGCCGGDCQS